MSLQVSQHHLVKRVPFLPWVFWLPLSTVWGCKPVDTFLTSWFCSVASGLFGFSVCVVYFEVRQCAVSSLALFSQDCFDFWGVDVCMYVWEEVS